MPQAGFSARLLTTGHEVYECMWAAIAGAHRTVRIETYIWKPGVVADRFLQELHAAVVRGVRVELLIDAYGSESLGAGYFAALQAAGAKLAWFNPHRFLRGSLRNHRKLLTADGERAIVGGQNIADEYDGDGVTCGWRDFAIELRGPIVAALDSSMDRMLQLAEFSPSALAHFARQHGDQSAWRGPEPGCESAQLLISGPGTRSAGLQRALRRDIEAASSVSVYAAYLVPTSRIRRALRRVARRGPVRLVTGARSDVPLVRWAAQWLYPFWLRGGVELYEYLPQVLHGKLLVVDDVVYAGSANLDIRSLRINYELLVRIQCRELAEEVRRTFEGDLVRCQRIEAAVWPESRRWWHGLRSWWAYLLVTRLDPYLSWRGLRRPS